MPSLSVLQRIFMKNNLLNTKPKKNAKYKRGHGPQQRQRISTRHNLHIFNSILSSGKKMQDINLVLIESKIFKHNDEMSLEGRNHGEAD